MTQIREMECPGVYRYLSMEEPDEMGIASCFAVMRLFCGMSGYPLESVDIDRVVPGSSLMRAGFVNLVFVLRSTDASGVAVPTLRQLTSDDLFRQALVRMVQLSGGGVLVARAANGRSLDVDFDVDAAIGTAI